MFRGMARNSFGTRPSVAFQRTNRGVPRAREQDRRVGPVFGRVGQCGVSELVECPTLSCRTEELDSPTVRQPGAAGKRASVDGRYGVRQPAIRQEHLAGGRSTKESREQQSRPVAPPLLRTRAQLPTVQEIRANLISLYLSSIACCVSPEFGSARELGQCPRTGARVRC